MKIILPLLLTGAAFVLGGCSEKGEKNPRGAVMRCVACHSFDKAGPKRSGPNLYAIMGQKAGARPGFTSSSAMRESGIIWSAATLDAFLAAPAETVPGNRMSFLGEPDAGKRKAIIAYIESQGRK